MINHLLQALQSGANPREGCALVACVFGAGMLLTELAPFPLNAYLNPNDSVRDESEVTPDIAYTGDEHRIYWANEKVIDIIDKYLAYRMVRLHRIKIKSVAYRGLDSDALLFLTDESEPYKLMRRLPGTGVLSYSWASLVSYSANCTCKQASRM